MKTFEPFKLLGWAVVLLTLAACSTTSRLGENDVLYTGVKHLKYHQSDSVVLDDGVKGQIFEVINVKPNNPLYSPYYRTPLPIGLWVYNHMDPNAKGFKGWIYKMLVSQPVLIRRVNPDTRVDMINTLLRNNGYFTSQARYELNYSRNNPKKAGISYDVDVRQPYRLGKIAYLDLQSPLTDFIDSLARRDTYLRTGSRYSLDSLNAVRVDITNTLRNRGYYYFRPEYIQYLADSVHRHGVVDIQLSRAADIPNEALMRYVTGQVTATVANSRGTGTPDTTLIGNLRLIRVEPVRLRRGVILSNVTARTGRPFRVNTLDRIQARLAQLGIFSNIDIQVIHTDSITPDGEGVLDLDVHCTVDDPWEVKVEVQATSKSNSFIGPGLELGATHKNLFGGGEKLSLNLTGSYEWQTGKGGGYKNSNFNSYEFGLESKLSIPRLLAPRFVDRSRRYLNWTRVGLNANILNRPKYFKMAQMGAFFTWEWHANKLSLNEYTPFSLTYNKLISTTTAFDSVAALNPAIAQSFADVFIPKMQYAYTFDKTIGPNHITLNATVSEAGNIFAGLWALAGSKGTKKLFGTPFSQFVKGEAQVVWRRSFTEKMKLVGRVYVGAAHAYGNLDEVPYREQFYVGGANSVRAFTVRSVGPGSYHPAVSSVYDYYDQTGTFKFETNWEFRFPILGYFNGAVFVDAGNVWLLKDDSYRPGGRLSSGFFKELALGTGVGLRFDMGMLVVRADLGVGLHAPYDTGKSGYFNMPRFKDALALHLAIGYPF